MRNMTIKLLSAACLTTVVLTGCASPPETADDPDVLWGHDIRTREMEVGREPGRRITLTDEVDIMRDTDERQRW